MQRQILINVIIFVAYVLNLPLNTQRPYHRSQRARKLGLDFGSWPVARYIVLPVIYIAVPLLGPHQPQYIGSTLYWFQNWDCNEPLNIVSQENHKMHIWYNLVILAQIHYKLSCGQAKFPRIVSQNGQNDLKIKVNARGVTIRVPHDTIRISIQRSRYNTYLDTYLNTVRCQRDVMSSMKAETPVIRSPAHNLLLQWMEYLLLQLPMLSQDVTLLSYIHGSHRFC